MKVKVLLGVFLLLGIGSWIYINRYSYFKYLPAADEKQLINVDGKLCDKSGKPFSGRVKRVSDDYVDIYSYKDGELDGLNVIYYKSLVKEIGHWKNGEQNGLFQMYTENGLLIDNANFKDGQRHGVAEEYYNDTGKLRALINYKNGTFDGEFKSYYPNGNIQIEANYKNGVIDGAYKEYYDNKSIKIIGNYKESLQDGEWRIYLGNGKLKSLVNYKDGALNGIKEDYYANGNLWTRRGFENNTQEGVYEVYYENGSPQFKAVVRNGVIVEEQKFDGNCMIYNEQEDKIIIKEIVSDSSDQMADSKSKK